MRLRDRLAANPSRGIAVSNTIAREALRNPKVASEFVDELVGALSDNRTVVAHRAANALKKIQQHEPALLVPFTKPLLRRALETDELLTRWNLTIILGELPLRGRDKALAIDLMFEALSSRSALQRVFALQALTNYARNDSALRARMQPIIQQALTDSSAAIRARARRLALQLKRSSRSED